MTNLVFQAETLSYKTSTNLTGDGCFAQAQVSHCHNGIHTSYGFPCLDNLQQKESISMEPVQGLKLNRRAISELEPEFR
jgi:hypothetical protein